MDPIYIGAFIGGNLNLHTTMMIQAIDNCTFILGSHEECF